MNDELFEQMEDLGAEAYDTLDRLGGDEEAYLGYLKEFPQNENIVKLRAAVAAGDHAAALSEVHTLKGVTLNLGLMPVSDPCIEMVRLYRAGKPEEADALLPEVEEQFRIWTDFIKGNC